MRIIGQGKSRALFSLFILVSVTLGIAGKWSIRRGTDSSATRKARIAAERFHFTPSRIKVKVGERIELELFSEDTSHGFRIPAANLNVTIPARGQGSVRVLFQSNKAGDFVFECSRPCGARHTMMRGVILVQ